MGSFDQKPRFASRPLEWLVSLGCSTEGATERFLTQLRCQLDKPSKNAISLVSLRSDFRKLMRHDEAIPIIVQRLRYGGPLYRAVSIWILSKNASRFNLLGINDYCDDPSPMVRKHVAKALRRLEAWDLLKNMARRHLGDDDVLRFVKPTPNKKSYFDRLTSYTDNINRVHATTATSTSRMPLWFRDDYWAGSRSKNIEYMRTILRRIKALVHG